jgi:hypothetical protein
MATSGWLRIAADGNEGEGNYLEDGLEGLPTEEVAAGDARQGEVVFDVKQGPPPSWSPTTLAARQPPSP